MRFIPGASGPRSVPVTPSEGPPIFFYRRSIELRAGVKVWVVYAVTPVEGEKPELVPVVAGFPEHWRPEPSAPGMCLFDSSVPARVYEALVPRTQFKNFERISEEDALELYPELVP